MATVNLFPNQKNFNSPQSLITNAANMVFNQPPPQNSTFSLTNNPNHTPSFGNIDDCFASQAQVQANNFNYHPNNYPQQPFNNSGLPNTTGFLNNNMSQSNLAPTSFATNPGPKGFALGPERLQTNNFPGVSNNFVGSPNNEQVNSFHSYTPAQKFVPLRSKNPKIDGKHLVKSITLAEGHVNMCLKQLRINHILQSTHTSAQFGHSNGSAFGVPPTSSFGFGNFASPQKQNMGLQSTTPISSGFNFATNANNANPIISTPVKANGNFAMSNQPLSLNSSSKGQFSLNNNQPQTSFLNNNSFSSQNPTTSFSPMTLNTNTTPFGNLNQFGSQNVQPAHFPTNNSPFPNSNTQSKGIFAPADTNSVTVFPKMLANPSATPTINQAAISIATNVLGSNLPSTQNFGNQFNTQPSTNSLLMNNNSNFHLNPQASILGYENMLLNSFFNSQFFRNIVSQNNKEPYERLAEDLKRKSMFDSKIFQFGEGDHKIDHLYQPTNPRKSAKKLQFFQKPYLFNEIQIDNSSMIETRKMPDKSIRNFKPTAIKMKNDQILKRTFFEQFQENFNRFQEKTLKEILVKPSDLPVNDLGLILNPNLEQLSALSPSQLKKVLGVCLENKYGKIKFLKPINLLGKKLSQCIRIEQDSIEIVQPQWGVKECQICFKNFGSYLSVGEVERRKIERKIKKWAQKNNMVIESFDKETGNLVVTLN